MGTRYTSESTSSYNTSPPSDDGSKTAANQVKWATIKTKLTDILKTAIDNINTKLVAALDTSAVAKTANYTTVVGDHAKTIEIGSTATSGITISLGDAATMAAGYYVIVSNQSVHAQTIGRETGGDTINSVAANVTLPPKHSAVCQINASTNGYLVTVESGQRASFSANKNGTDQTSVSAGTKITFGTEDWDIGSYFASSTWTPPAGKYRITAAVNISSGITDSSSYGFAVYKNGAAHKSLGSISASGTGGVVLNGSAIVDANGTDTFEIYLNTASTTVTIGGAATSTYFQGEQL